MSKRKVTFDEEANEEYEDISIPQEKKSKHSLDSDEDEGEGESNEEEKDDYYNLDDRDAEEEGVSRFDDDVKITPFNMNEELEEGIVNKDGDFVYDKKKKEELTDNWLENIDWVKVCDKQQTSSKADQESDLLAGKEINVGECYQGMVAVMQPGETVAKSIQRLGKSGKKIKRGQKLSDLNKEDAEEITADREKLSTLSGYADQLLQTGDMNAYDKTFESLNHLINERRTVESSDMFADDFEPSSSKSSLSTKVAAPSSSTSWEFKWDNKDDAPVYGPHSNTEMIKWVNDGYFDVGVWVRQTDKTDAQFYNSKRIDFELFE